MEIAPQMVDALTAMLMQYATRAAKLERKLGAALQIAEAAVLLAEGREGKSDVGTPDKRR